MISQPVSAVFFHMWVYYLELHIVFFFLKAINKIFG